MPPTASDEHPAKTTTPGLPPVCILAGGLGTRLGELVRDTPKPLIEVAGKPFLMHQLQLLAAHGASEIVLCVGYHGEQIQSRIGNEYAGLHIRYSHDAPGLDGTLGAIRRAQPLLGERFLVLYGDTYLRINYTALATTWQQSKLPAVMSVLHNNNRWDTSNAHYDGHLVTTYNKHHPTPNMHWIDYGLGGLTTTALKHAPKNTTDLSTLYQQLAAHHELLGYQAHKRFYEIGTPTTLTETDTFLRTAEDRHAQEGRHKTECRH